jgi:hypothetical protein
MALIRRLNLLELFPKIAAELAPKFMEELANSVEPF